MEKDISWPQRDSGKRFTKERGRGSFPSWANPERSGPGISRVRAVFEFLVINKARSRALYVLRLHCFPLCYSQKESCGATKSQRVSALVTSELHLYFQWLHGSVGFIRPLLPAECETVGMSQVWDHGILPVNAELPSFGWELLTNLLVKEFSYWFGLGFLTKFVIFSFF